MSAASSGPAVGTAPGPADAAAPDSVPDAAPSAPAAIAAKMHEPVPTGDWAGTCTSRPSTSA